MKKILTADVADVRRCDEELLADAQENGDDKNQTKASFKTSLTTDYADGTNGKKERN